MILDRGTKLSGYDEEDIHCVKSVRFRSYSGPHFPAFGLNTERYGVIVNSVLRSVTLSLTLRIVLETTHHLSLKNLMQYLGTYFDERSATDLCSKQQAYFNEPTLLY